MGVLKLKPGVERRVGTKGKRRPKLRLVKSPKPKKTVLVKEVGPRDGLQNEKNLIPLQSKIDLVRGLIDAGHRYIEVTAFVNPKVIPQLADAEELLRDIPRSSDVIISALVPNQKGMERALQAGVDEVAVFTAASETFNQKNINASIAESFERFQDVFSMARDTKKKVRGYVSTCFVCPYEGRIKPRQVLEVVTKLLELGCYEVSIGDTIGQATPKMVAKLFSELLELAPARTFAGHFHDTYGMALANVMEAFDMGIRTFDSSIGGLGGCPYAPGASGNLATEDLVYAMENMNVNTGLSLDRLVETSMKIEPILGHSIPSKVYQAHVSRLRTI